MKKLVVEIENENELNEFKATCAMKGVSMKDVISTFITNYVENHQPEEPDFNYPNEAEAF